MLRTAGAGDFIWTSDTIAGSDDSNTMGGLGRMGEALTNELESSLRAMEQGFLVQLIATFGGDLVCAPAEASAVQWLAEHSTDFDQFPVRQGDETIGILDRRDEHGNRSVLEAMQPLREGLIVSAHMPITDLIPKLRESAYRLVLRGGRIDGLVTQSDLLKLPVRLVSFALITHLEQVMAVMIAKRWPDNTWFSKLSEGRRKKLNDKLEDLTKQKMNPPLLELSEFSDKRNLCKELLAEGKSNFIDQLEELRVLRDQIAHAATFIDPSRGTSDGRSSWIVLSMQNIGFLN
jgi:hypothetical protein